VDEFLSQYNKEMLEKLEEKDPLKLFSVLVAAQRGTASKAGRM
jgi:hypothetical protein